MVPASGPASAVAAAARDGEVDIFGKRRNPLVLVGGLVTAGIPLSGFAAFRNGNVGLSQNMMRARVVAQGVTVAIMVGSSGIMSKYLVGGDDAKAGGSSSQASS